MLRIGLAGLVAINLSRIPPSLILGKFMTIRPAEKDMSEWISELTYERKPLDK